MLHCLLYVLLIVAVNVGFSYVPLVPMPTGEMWPPMSLAVGLVFVQRDFAQRAVGHNVLWAMAAGLVLSWLMANPYVALASAAAFAVSELADWIIYSVSKQSFHRRIIWSSAISTPIDSAVFLAMIGHLSLSGVLAMVASKMLGALLIVWWLKRDHGHDH